MPTAQCPLQSPLTAKRIEMPVDYRIGREDRRLDFEKAAGSRKTLSAVGAIRRAAASAPSLPKDETRWRPTATWLTGFLICFCCGRYPKVVGQVANLPFSRQIGNLPHGGKRGQAPFAGTALRVLRTNGACPLFPSLVFRVQDYPAAGKVGGQPHGAVAVGRRVAGRRCRQIRWGRSR